MGVLIIPTATTAQRTGITPDVGELIYDTDLNLIYRGDGSTVGGVALADAGAGVLTVTGTGVDNTDSQNPVITTLEEIVFGTALYNATMTGTVDLDLAAFTAYYGILTGNTTITVSNIPAGGKTIVKSLTIKSTASETLTLPGTWLVIGTYVADGSENDIQIEFSNFPTVGLVVKVYINEL